MSDRIESHRDLLVDGKSFSAVDDFLFVSKQFPREDTSSLTDQVRRSSRSVSANIAEAWRRRRYDKSFRSSLNNSEADAADTQVWVDYPMDHGCLTSDEAAPLNEACDEIPRKIVAMNNAPQKWCFTH